MIQKGSVAKYLQQTLKAFPYGEGGSRSETDEGPYETEQSDKAFIEPLYHRTPLFHHRFAAVPLPRWGRFSILQQPFSRFRLRKTHGCKDGRNMIK